MKTLLLRSSAAGMKINLRGRLSEYKTPFFRPSQIFPPLTSCGVFPTQQRRNLRSDNIDPSPSRDRSIKIVYTKTPPPPPPPPASETTTSPPVSKGTTEEDPQPPSKMNQILSSMGMLGAGLMFLGGKGKVMLFAALKLGKMGSLVSIFASTAAYSLLFGFPFAVGLVGLLMVHELGHILVLRQLGVPFRPMYLIPFMGAVVSHDQVNNAYDSAKVALGGPLVGGVASLGVALTGQAMDSQFLIALGDFGLYLNLINLLPIGQLDGGQVTASLSKWFMVGGLGLGAGMVFTGLVSSPLFYLILGMGGIQTFQRFYGGRSEEEERFYDIPPKQKVFIGTNYAALVILLLGLHAWNAKKKKSPAQIQRELLLAGGQGQHAATASHPQQQALPEWQQSVFDWAKDPDQEALEKQDMWYQRTTEERRR